MLSARTCAHQLTPEVAGLDPCMTIFKGTWADSLGANPDRLQS